MKNLLRIILIKQLIALYKALIEKMRSKKGYKEFASALKKRESGNRYHIENQFGYLGAYQFGMARLTDLGYAERIPGTSGFRNSAFQWKSPYSKKWFLDSIEAQDKIFAEHMEHLVDYFKPNSYIGLSVKGIKITLSGLVAGAHLGGIGGVKDFLSTGNSSSDAFGTSVSDYIKKFGGYNLEQRS